MSDITQETIEEVTNIIMKAFDIDQPPIPVELMIERPREGLWERADLAELTSSFLVMTDRFSPRMSVARLLARHIARSDWGNDNGIGAIYGNKEHTNAFARAILMPENLLRDALNSGQSEVAIINRFEVPSDDFEIRVEELNSK